jgi:two-component system, OmpR family, alkaline phosphatase synthesis response regulator PhoP
MINADIKILVVDDDEDILEFTRYNLDKEGFDVITAMNGLQAIEVAVEQNPQLIILDVMMPVMDGIEACRQLRDNKRFQNTIILFLTARGEEYSELAGFDVGADDYISKPIKPRILLARIKNLLKLRYEGKDSEEEIRTFKEIKINIEKRVVIIDGKKIDLPRKQFGILKLLSSQPERYYTRDEIFMKVWGDEVIVGDRTLDVHIRKLREKIGESFIKTSKGTGYAFIAEND